MAKSASFFTLRRGSTKSLTFQVLRGKQITKDRVTTVSNPQSTTQMDQRLRMPVIAYYRARLKGLVDHSFQSKAYGYESLQYFSSKNLAKDGAVIDSFAPKGLTFASLANVLVSEGSLATITPKPSTDGTASLDGVTFSSLGSGIGKAFSGDDAQALINGSGGILQDGDQITFLIQYATRGNFDVSLHSSDKNLPVNGFVIARLQVDTTNGDSNWKVTAASSSATWTDGYVEITSATDGEPTVRQKVYNQGDALGCEAIAVIISRKSGETWMRSTSRLIPNPNLDSSFLVSYDDAKRTYLKDESSSAKYLNNGNESTYITGQIGSTSSSSSSSSTKTEG